MVVTDNYIDAIVVCQVPHISEALPVAPWLMEPLRAFESGAGSQINVPIAILIWLMITR
jgi:hypothetical protein